MHYPGEMAPYTVVRRCRRRRRRHCCCTSAMCVSSLLRSSSLRFPVVNERPMCAIATENYEFFVCKYHYELLFYQTEVRQIAQRIQK